MLPRILKKDAFDDFVKFLLTSYRVVAPVVKGPQFVFAQIESDSDIGSIRMDYDQSILPPKKYLMPQFENLLSFQDGKPSDAHADIEAQPTAMLGVHPYDLWGIATTDAALCQDPLDPYYKAKRNAALLIGMNIASYINEHQFMSDMNTLEPPSDGFDLFLTDLGDSYYVEVGSETGSQLANDCGVCGEAGPADHKVKQDYEAAKIVACEKRLPYDTKYLPDLLEQSYDSLLWEAVAQRCFSCGSCTNICPTCYCFDISDKLDLNLTSGVRQRKWDSCQLGEFAEVAGGENFRENRASRLRHRMFRKGKFVLERTGRTGCVGCGRCSLQCIANISILEAFQQIADQAVEADA